MGINFRWCVLMVYIRWCAHITALLLLAVGQKKKLCTKDRMLKWGFIGDIVCTFSRGGIEVRNHIFVAIGYGGLFNV